MYACYCVCSLEKKCLVHIDTGDTLHVHSKIHIVDNDDDDLMLTVIAMLSFVFHKAW